MCHVCGFIWYLCVELKLIINTKSLSNQTLKSEHPSLLSSRCWPWEVFICAGQPLQHGEVTDTNLAWVRPVILGFHPANERRRYFVSTSLVVWVQAQNQPCYVSVANVPLGLMNMEIVDDIHRVITAPQCIKSFLCETDCKLISVAFYLQYPSSHGYRAYFNLILKYGILDYEMTHVPLCMSGSWHSFITCQYCIWNFVYVFSTQFYLASWWINIQLPLICEFGKDKYAISKLIKPGLTTFKSPEVV